MSEERDFEVVDRRRVRTDGEPAAAQTEAGEAEGADAPGAGEQPEPQAAEVERPDEEQDTEEQDTDEPTGMPSMEMGVTAILVTAMNLLDARAWASLGLVPDPMTGKIEKDLSEARRAIDALADVIKHLETEATDAEKRELRGNLSNLRINYVRLSG